jgi:hypothetical protein
MLSVFLSQFIDAMEDPEPSGALSPEDTALALAISAAQLCNAPSLRAKVSQDHY